MQKIAKKCQNIEMNGTVKYVEEPAGVKNVQECVKMSRRMVLYGSSLDVVEGLHVSQVRV